MTCFDLEHALQTDWGVEGARSVTELQTALDGVGDFADAVVDVTPDPALGRVARRLNGVLRQLEAAGQASATPADFIARVRRSPALQRDLVNYQSTIKYFKDWRAQHC